MERIRERLIKGLKLYLKYTWEETVRVEMSRETAMNLIKELDTAEQEPVIDSFLNRRCPTCRAILKGRFCFECGQKIKWRD